MEYNLIGISVKSLEGCTFAISTVECGDLNLERTAGKGNVAIY